MSDNNRDGEAIWHKHIKTEQMKGNFPKNFNDYARLYNDMHPIAKLFHEAMLAVEKLGASPEQTDAIVKLGKCKDEVEKIMFSGDAYKLGKVDGFLQGYEESGAKQGAPREIDWQGFRADFYGKFYIAGKINEKYSPAEIFYWIRDWFKSRPEFQSQSPTGKFSEADMRKCFEAGRRHEYHQQFGTINPAPQTFDDYLLSLDESKKTD